MARLVGWLQRSSGRNICVERQEKSWRRGLVVTSEGGSDGCFGKSEEMQGFAGNNVLSWPGNRGCADQRWKVERKGPLSRVQCYLRRPLPGLQVTRVDERRRRISVVGTMCGRRVGWWGNPELFRSLPMNRAELMSSQPPHPSWLAVSQQSATAVCPEES